MHIRAVSCSLQYSWRIELPIPDMILQDNFFKNRWFISKLRIKPRSCVFQTLQKPAQKRNGQRRTRLQRSKHHAAIFGPHR